ncbi:hypothetical protein [Pontibacillus salipaludis]|uniref:hypothetical protein n=1 Tax=Pontibacillus salipaludis TaxID=1697394 RepID=UPI0031F01E41
MKKKLLVSISALAFAFTLHFGVSEVQGDPKGNVGQSAPEIMLFSDPNIKGVGK